MPPCPCDSTAGTFVTGVFSPFCVTSQSGPTFSVMSMRPSGRNAMRHGRLKVATWVIVNGRVASGVCVPALTCAPAPLAKVKDKTAIANFMGYLWGVEYLKKAIGDGELEGAIGKCDWKARLETAIGYNDWKRRGAFSDFDLSNHLSQSPFPLAVSVRSFDPTGRLRELPTLADARAAGVT